MSCDPQAAELAALLRQMATLLLRHDRIDWAGKLDHCRLIIESADSYGISRLLELWRGPASLKEIELDHRVDNERFAALQARAWGLAERMRRKRRSGQ